MDGGGAIFVRGGRFRVIDSQFYGNRCASTGPDVGGAAIQVFSQSRGPARSTSSGAPSVGPGTGATSVRMAAPSRASACRGRSSTACSRQQWRSAAGANPPKAGTPGGGNGGAIYNDGNEMLLHVEGTRIEGNSSNHEGGSAIFFVSNDRTGIGARSSTRSCATTPATASRPTRGSSSWAMITFTGSTVE